MKLRFILPCAISLAFSLTASPFIAAEPALDTAVTISPDGLPSPVTCFFMVTPSDPNAVAGVTKWRIFVPRQNSDPARHVDLPLRAQEIRTDQAWRIVMISKDGSVHESGEAHASVTGPERDLLSPLYQRLDGACDRLKKGPA